MPLFMHEQTRDPTRPRVDVFVRAPDGEIDVPGVQRERNVADCVRKVPADDAALREWLVRILDF